ncbi:hypothetical protein Pelo_15803 [Pelomyxa schiedti]|nr:hypothetical protein Pelo_15803 [Pelomyxa schiedti]
MYFCDNKDIDKPFYTHDLVASGCVSCSESLHTMILKPFFQDQMFDLITQFIPGLTQQATEQSRMIHMQLPQQILKSMEVFITPSTQSLRLRTAQADCDIR